MVKSADELSDTARSRLLVQHSRGETIFREGQPGAEMFIVEEGQVEIVRSVGPNERRLALLEEGDFFGEMALLEDQPRSASARAVSDCQLLPIDASTFDQMLREFPEVAVRMLRRLSRRLREYDEESHRAREIAAGHFAGVSRDEVRSEPVVSGAGSAERAEEAAEPARGGGSRKREVAGVLSHSGSGSTFEVPSGGDAILGRFDPVTGQSPAVDLGPLDDQKTLSRRHARIRVDAGKVLLREEIGTANGTWVNGVKLETGKEVEIGDGDTIRLGLVDLTFRRPGTGAA